MLIDQDDKFQADESDPFEDDCYFADYDPRWLEDFATGQKDPISDATGRDSKKHYNINEGLDDPLI